MPFKSDALIARVSENLMTSPLLLRDLRLLCAELTILAPAAVPLLLLLDPAVLGRVVPVVMQEVLFVLMELKTNL